MKRKKRSPDGQKNEKHKTKQYDMWKKKTENNKTDQEVSKEYSKQKLKKLKRNDENYLFGNQIDLLCKCSHEQHLGSQTYIKLIQSRSGRIEECQEGILWILMLHTYKWQNLIKRPNYLNLT